MMFDYGGDALKSQTEAEQYIDELMKNFTVFIVAERYDESLVVIKNKMCCDWSDIVYVRTNERKYSYGVKNNWSAKGYRIGSKLS